MNPNPQREHPRGFELNPDVRSWELSRLPQLGQMKTGITPRLVSTSASLPNLLSADVPGAA
jgi:hypothetical protein